MGVVDPASGVWLGLPGVVYMWIILVCGISLFAYVIYKRYLLLNACQADPRFSSSAQRISGLFTFGIIQKRQPRYFLAGVGHIFIFWGFVVLGLRSVDLVTQGLGFHFLKPLMESSIGSFYNSLKDVFELLVLAACVVAIFRRAVLKPKRYQGSHSFEAYLVLVLICLLMITDMFFEASALSLKTTRNSWLPAAALAAEILPLQNAKALGAIYQASYWLHIIAFFFMLNLLPLSKHFHIITALPNIFFRKLTKGSIKPARWGVDDIEELKTLGVETLTDFTWKDVLDFYTCTECGRCSDNCPANASGRPLSPKMITIKLRDHAYMTHPVFGGPKPDNEAAQQEISGGVISSEEIWSCTTCGACEEECPVFIGYIDKIIDMRRNLIENSRNPKTFNQVLMHIEKTGNPFGKPASKRADWIKEAEDISARVLKKGDKADVLYYVDSFGSYDPRIQNISASIVRGLNKAGIDFGILGPREKDSGHQVRRLGEEGLFSFLVEENMETLSSISFNRIITTDPHAMNTIRKDYPGSFDIMHYSQFFLSLVESGKLNPAKTLLNENIYTYHDPCYLGRHNEIYDEPRRLINSIAGINFVEMKKSRDRGFCCGGGDVILWHEIKEETRMASLRIQMAKEAGANVIITACPFCLIHFEDAIKTSGLEKEMRVIDLMELFISTL
ncbi:Cysteine-rich domain protein [uncultured Desulfobacterium sp.]|uniref:Cysteine-rich domain protein n=1 Tax=uncultured Desulfobacterium sp. TaxID=201089 RepID=A0A445MTI1_9BACT|nr:Cysteine-rich domain protein [uncultured Desulfobacterium sp.]